jgi:hypothetical protein
MSRCVAREPYSVAGTRVLRCTRHSQSARDDTNEQSARAAFVAVLQRSVAARAEDAPIRFLVERRAAIWRRSACLGALR